MNPRHFETIKQSVEEYNKWRADNWNIKPDFSGANMHGMNLFKANLSNANLTDVDLSGAELISIEAYSADFTDSDLSNTQLQGASFFNTNLTGVDFRGANLMGAEIKNCNLMEADLSDSNCMGAKFYNSNFKNASFYNAETKGAIFEGSNLQDAKMYAEDFEDAKIALEVSDLMQKKSKGTKKITKIVYLAFIFLAATFILGFFLCNWIFSTNAPGATSTKLRASFYGRMGYIMMAMKKNSRAIILFKKSLKYNDRDALVHNYTATAYKKLGDYKNAVKHYRMFVLLDPDAPTVDAAEKFIHKYRYVGNEEKEEEKKKK